MPKQRRGDMHARQLAYFIERISKSQTTVALRAIAVEIETRFSSDEATHRLSAIIAVRIARLTRMTDSDFDGLIGKLARTRALSDCTAARSEKV
jgi:hypothetical protein